MRLFDYIKKSVILCNSSKRGEIGISSLIAITLIYCTCTGIGVKYKALTNYGPTYVEEVESVSSGEAETTTEQPVEEAQPPVIKVEKSGEATSKVYRYATEDVNIRAEQSLNSTKLGSISAGTPIEYVGTSDGWDSVIYNGVPAFIKSGYLSESMPFFETVTLSVKERGIDPNLPMVALTFDDGPNPSSTTRILNTLEKFGVVATFFDLGYLVDAHPEITQREEAIGCEVGSHSYNHKNLNKLSAAQLKQDVEKTEAVFERVLGHKFVLFRPPYGNANNTVQKNINYPLINWNVDSLDWKYRDKTKNLNRIFQTKNFDGHIILMHSIHEATADTVEDLVPELLRRGYQLVTVSELAYYKGYKELRVGSIYRGF